MSKGKDSKPHIGIFGRRNNGKSSFINALANQDIAIVSDIPGTTTDPVKKSMEISGIGPVILIDTAGIDDVGELGKKRVDKTLEVLKTVDLAILIIAGNDFNDTEKSMIDAFNDYNVPFFIIHNKSDLEKLKTDLSENITKVFKTDVLDFSTTEKNQIGRVITLINKYMPETAYSSKPMIGDLLSYGDVVLLITPIDIEAPQGRLILPQVQTIRDVLDNDCICVVLKEKEVDAYFQKMNPKPRLVVCDSQVFLKADAVIPKDIMLTSFSIVLARQRGDFENYLKGTPHISKLKNGDKVLILESCTHHVTCDDIGRMKIPRWISNYTGKKLTFEVVSGLAAIPGKINDYAMVIQCGGCVLTRKQVVGRLKAAVDAGVPVSNYGMTIAYVHGIYERAVAPFMKIDKNTLDYL
ncbi:MAG: [FeFe] hydrogenase H-cluster maturation GTPase HydF [Bacteroidales bacterium]|nr:[FeFe] hydrogenase H-cluster maturation GTPase HydF [Bacteroidales bacterium]